MEAMVAGTWLNKSDKETVLKNIETHSMDTWLKTTYDFIKNPSPKIKNSNLIKNIDKKSALFAKGEAIYNKEGYCGTCHQPNGNGLESSGFPPLSKSKWVTGNTDRLIKVVLNGLYGPLEINGVKYLGNVPMTPYGGMLNDEEIAAVLNYVRNSFGNNVPELVTPTQIKEVRDKTKKQKGFYTPQELLKLHPDM